MKKDVMANMDLSILPTLGLFLFLAVFIGALLWSFRKGTKKFYDDISVEALNDGTPLMTNGEKDE